MRVLAWNLNHRAAVRRIPTWVAPELARQQPDLAVLTEYVEGPGHRQFLHQLAAAGLPHVLTSAAVHRQNQVLVASAIDMASGELHAPAIHAAVPPNVLHAIRDDGVHCLAVRIPCFQGSDRPMKRRTWEWLLAAAHRLRDTQAIIAGDFNTDPTDSSADCGDCLRQLTSSGWQRGQPAKGHSFTTNNARRHIDHLCVSPSLRVENAVYCWDFLQQLTENTFPPGIPDHALLRGDIFDARE